jgi:hypothetical protein
MFSCALVSVRERPCNVLRARAVPLEHGVNALG